MKHLNITDGPAICATQGTVDEVVDATRAVFGGVDCPGCLRRAVAESEARTHVLRELLDKVEVLS